MALITITVTESDREPLAGIPAFVTLSTSIPSTIFYTLDGTTPDTTSLVYTGGELELPTNQPTVTLKLLATNGTDSSAIIERIFRPDIISLRKSHDRVTLPSDGKNTQFPYATAGPGAPTSWGNIGPADRIVDKPGVENVFDGYGADGLPTGGTDKPLSEYMIKFSVGNRSNTERGRGIGTLPSEVDVVEPEEPPLTSDRQSKTFNPKALVIYQDSREEPFDPDIVSINRGYFSLVNPETSKDGALFQTVGLETPPPSGSFVRSHFNPRNNTITYYYFDSHALRWIISTEPFTPGSPREGLSNIVFSPRGKGDEKVFRWIPFKGSRLI